MATKRDFGFFTIHLRDDKVIHVAVKAKNEIGIEQIIEIIQGIALVGESKKHPIMITVEDHTFPTPEARKYLAQADTNPFASASAFIVKNLAQKLLVNAYLKMNRPSRPTRMFTTEESAIQWLKTFL
ncbi:MAG: hypothetical protein L6Q66_09625 [Bacteroidia bacterium]|nr:hypothetical protein [Bacteroidia bacterium]